MGSGIPKNTLATSFLRPSGKPLPAAVSFQHQSEQRVYDQDRRDFFHCFWGQWRNKTHIKMHVDYQRPVRLLDKQRNWLQM